MLKADPGGGNPLQTKGCDVHCKALCKIHIYRIIKSVQTQVACTAPLWGWEKPGKGEGLLEAG